MMAASKSVIFLIFDLLLPLRRLPRFRLILHIQNCVDFQQVHQISRAVFHFGKADFSRQHRSPNQKFRFQIGAKTPYGFAFSAKPTSPERFSQRVKGAAKFSLITTTKSCNTSAKSAKICPSRANLKRTASPFSSS